MSVLLPKLLTKYKQAQEEFSTVCSGASTPPLRKGGGGSGLTCSYLGCNKEVRYVCPRCYLPFCEQHINNHICRPINEVLKQLRLDRESIERLTELSKFFDRSYVFDYLWKEYRRDEVLPHLTRVVPVYSAFLTNFVSRIRGSPHSVSECDVVKYIFARLAFKLMEFLQKHERVIAMDHDVYNELISGNPRCDARLCGKAFQWWLTLEIMDMLYEHDVTNIDLYSRCLALRQGDSTIEIFFGSFRVQEVTGVRPDVLSIKARDFRLGKVIEMKLSHQALANSWDQIERYLKIWGGNNIVIAIALPQHHH